MALALENIGNTVKKLAEKMAAIDAKESQFMNQVFGNKNGTTESDMILKMARQNRIKREHEVAALVRDEVRILTNQIAVELQQLRVNFFSDIREMLYDLRQNLKVSLLNAFCVVHSCTKGLSCMDRDGHTD